MTKRDYYEVLDISRTSTEIEIKKAFRRLAMKYHPDRNPGDHEAEVKFKEVKEAYEILSDSQKRMAYDQFGHAGVDPNFGAGSGGVDLGDILSGFGGLGDLFGEMFGRSQGGKQRGADLAYDLSLSLEEAVQGVTKSIRLPTWINCESCAGTGAKKDTQPETCQQCRGTGQMRMRHGFLEVQQTCSVCRGAGKIIKEPCVDCRGQGRVKHTKTLSVKIPAGVDTGDRIRLSGEGEAGVQGAPTGDLYVQVQVQPHKIFHRKGNDLHVEVPLYFITAILGGDIEIPTLSGPAALTIPAGTQTGEQFRLRGKGIKALRSGSIGDLICHVSVETPVKLSNEAKALLQQVDEALKKDGKEHSARSRTWLDSVKEFFSTKKE